MMNDTNSSPMKETDDTLTQTSPDTGLATAEAQQRLQHSGHKRPISTRRQ